MEIGTFEGASLRISECASLAIDPDFRISDDVVGSKPLCILAQTTSDNFFSEYDVLSLLGAPVDLAFIDGFHIFEYVLRDFIGTERSCHRRSVIVMDDCCPRDIYMTRRQLAADPTQQTRYEGYWTGDVWKLVPVLRQFRPDIELTFLDTTPTGVGVCMSLDPDSTVLSVHYAEIVEQWRDVSLAEYGMDRLLDDLRLGDASEWLNTVAPLHPSAGPAVVRTRPPSVREQLIAESALLAALQNSRSWRLTAPLRATAGAIRRLANRRG
jgi:hypothetical protein